MDSHESMPLTTINPAVSEGPAGTLVPLSISAALLFLEELDPENFARQKTRRLDKLVSSEDESSWSWSDGTPGGDAIDLLVQFGSLSREQWIEKINSILASLTVEDRVDLAPRVREQTVDDRRFPVDALPEILKELTCNLARVHGVPPEFIAAYAMAVTGAAAGKGIAVKTWRGLKVYPNIYVLAGLESGFGKSVVTNPLLKPFLEFERKLEAEHDVDIPKIDAELAIVQKQIGKILSIREGANDE